MQTATNGQAEDAYAEEEYHETLGCAAAIRALEVVDTELVEELPLHCVHFVRWPDFEHQFDECSLASNEQHPRGFLQEHFQGFDVAVNPSTENVGPQFLVVALPTLGQSLLHNGTHFSSTLSVLTAGAKAPNIRRGRRHWEKRIQTCKVWQ